MDASTSLCLTSPLSPAWAGLEAAKNTFEAAVVCALPDGDRTGLPRSIPVESFPRTAEGAARRLEQAMRKIAAAAWPPRCFSNPRQSAPAADPQGSPLLTETETCSLRQWGLSGVLARSRLGRLAPGGCPPTA